MKPFELQPADRVTRTNRRHAVDGTVKRVSKIGTRVRVSWDDGTENSMDINSVKKLSSEPQILKKHGGHNAKGHGLVFEIREALGLTQAEMAEKIKVSVPTIQRCEAAGTLPTGLAARSNLHALAPVSSEPTTAGEPEPGGIFL